MRAAVALPPPVADVPALIPYDATAKKALELTFREAVRLGAEHVGTEHVLLALLEVENGDGPLSSLGLTKAGVDELVAAGAYASRPPAAPPDRTTDEARAGSSADVRRTGAARAPGRTRPSLPHVDRQVRGPQPGPPAEDDVDLVLGVRLLTVTAPPPGRAADAQVRHPQVLGVASRPGLGGIGQQVHAAASRRTGVERRVTGQLSSVAATARASTEDDAG